MIAHDNKTLACNRCHVERRTKLLEEETRRVEALCALMTDASSEERAAWDRWVGAFITRGESLDNAATLADDLVIRRRMRWPGKGDGRG